MKINENDIYKALKETIFPEDKIILLYSGIWTFGQYLNCNLTEIPDILLDIIEDFSGRDRTIIMPGYCASDFVKTRKYDSVNSKPKESGIIPERAMSRPGYSRTKQPMHSYIVKGPETENILNLKGTTSWGEDSIFELLSKKNAKVCALGLPLHKACSYFHRIEEKLKVPYRYFKRFAGTLYEDNKEIGPCQEVKYSYSLHIPFEYDFSIVAEQLNKYKYILSGSNPLIPLKTTTTREIDEVSQNIFSDDIYAIVINRQETMDWVKNGKADEINNLLPEEKWDFSTQI